MTNVNDTIKNETEIRTLKSKLEKETIWHDEAEHELTCVLQKLEKIKERVNKVAWDEEGIASDVIKLLD